MGLQSDKFPLLRLGILRMGCAEQLLFLEDSSEHRQDDDICDCRK